jgi:AAA domain
MKLTDYKSSATKRVLIHGISGSGKSTLAAEMSLHGYKLIWLNIENAADTLLKLPVAAQDNINLINIPDSSSYPIAAQTLLTLFKSGKAQICDSHGKTSCPICARDPESIVTLVDFSTLGSNDIVVLDTATQLSYSIMAFTMKDKSVEIKPERDDWGALRKYTEFFKSQFQGARFNLIVVCQSQEADLEDGVSKLVPSFGSAGMSAAFGSAFDTVVFTEIKNGKHRAYSKSTASPKFLSRSRSDFAIEDAPIGSLSLLPIFNTEAAVPKASVVSAPAHGTKAVSDLQALAASLKR